MKRICFYFILTTILLACDKANPRTVKAWISASDTLVQNRIIKEQAKIDSICLSNTAAYYKIAYDSIYAKRWSEMKYLLDSIRAQ